MTALVSIEQGHQDATLFPESVRWQYPYRHTQHRGFACRGKQAFCGVHVWINGDRGISLVTWRRIDLLAPVCNVLVEEMDRWLSERVGLHWTATSGCAGLGWPVSWQNPSAQVRRN